MSDKDFIRDLSDAVWESQVESFDDDCDQIAQFILHAIREDGWDIVPAGGLVLTAEQVSSLRYLIREARVIPHPDDQASMIDAARIVRDALGDGK